MSTLHHLDLALIDIRDRMTKELQFTVDSQRQVGQAFDTLDEALAHLKATIDNAFSERQRALATALGSPGPQPETLEQAAPRKAPKLVKAASDA